MTNEMLKELKKLYKNHRESIIETNKKITRINLLQNNPAVKEYFAITDQADDLKPYEMQQILSEEELLGRHFRRDLVKRIDQKDTNNIYLYMGSFIRNTGYEYHGERTQNKITTRKDTNASYRRYWNLEQEYAIEIPYDECREFESTHHILFSSETPVLAHEYYDIQEDFLVEATHSSQEQARDIIIRKYNINNEK